MHGILLMNDKQIVSVFDKCVNVDWTALWKVIGTKTSHTVCCDDHESLLIVIADNQGDMHLNTIEHPEAEEYCRRGFSSPTFRARTFAGGGRNERVRIALALLALAIVEDTSDTYDK